MKPSSRLFNCARCYHQVVVCSDCDRGQIYCGPSCSDVARVQSCRKAQKRYQKSFKGRMKHAMRQRRYRALLKKVTHHTSPPTSENGLLSLVENTVEKPVIPKKPCQMRCHFCQKIVSFWLRRGFLRHCAETADLKPP